jgi:CRISPR/Cas system CMR subunit Cmr6 (Cas7 group RAMP superfamily)
LAKYTKEENQMLKNREKKGLKAQGQQYKKRLKLLKVENKKAIQNSRAALSKNYDKLLRQHVMELNHYKNTVEK